MVFKSSLSGLPTIEYVCTVFVAKRFFMKHFSILLPISLLLCCTNVFAQKNTLSLSASYLPVGDNPVSHASFGYFRQIGGNQALGLKAMLSSNGLGADEDRTILTINNLDLVHRWTFSKNNRASQWNFEAGVSTAWTVEKIPPYDNWGFCGTGMTAEEMAEMQRYYEEVLSKPHIERMSFVGLASAASWQVALTPRLGVGVGTIFNVYFSPKNGWQFLPMPNLNFGYSF